MGMPMQLSDRVEEQLTVMVGQAAASCSRRAVQLLIMDVHGPVK
jgi:hypothetical protein